MNRFRNGLAVNRDDDDPVRRPRPASQEGYDYPSEHPEYGDFHSNSHPRRYQLQPMRQYGSSASLEVRREYNQEQREREFFSPSNPPSRLAPPGHEPPPGHPRGVSVISEAESEYDLSDYYYSSRTSRQSQSSVYGNRHAHENTLSPPSPVGPQASRAIAVPSTRSAQKFLSPADASNQYSSYQYSSYSSDSPSSSYQSSTFQRSPSPSSRAQNFARQPPSSSYTHSPLTVPEANHHPSASYSRHMNSPQPSFSPNLHRPVSQESLADPFVNVQPSLPHLHMKPPERKSSLDSEKSSGSRQRSVSPQPRSRSPSPLPTSRSVSPLPLPRSVSPQPAQQRPQHAQQPNNRPQQSGQSQQRANTDSAGEPVTLDDYVARAIALHEANELEKSTNYFRIAADKGSHVAMVLFGLALRHGWGCNVDSALAFKYLQRAAEQAAGDINGLKSANMSAVRCELILAIYELGVCFRHGWGVPKNKSTAAHYFEIAANLGDPDAQNDIGLCYFKGDGVKKDMHRAAKYYKMAHAQGHGTMGNSWIFKEKYNNVENE